ncbi:MAG: ferrous iron transport protein A [Mycoplasma sp.]|nr:ferrous iron transport protein A [Mycoplasma sp.]MBQ6280060.1 ferrous iron transport protein A [Mycoplasma sp.]
MILTSKFKGKTVLVKQINFKDPYISHKLENIGLVPGVTIKILDYNRNNKLMHLDIYNVEYVLRTEDCKYIDVEEVK